jgi:hypothetical protein
MMIMKVQQSYQFSNKLIRFHTNSRSTLMTNITNLDGLISCIVIMLCSCVLLRRVKAMHPLFMKKQFGPLSVLLKASVIGTRVAGPLSCFAMVLAVIILLR